MNVCAAMGVRVESSWISRMQTVYRAASEALAEDDFVRSVADESAVRLLHPLHVSRPTDKQQPGKDFLDEGTGLRNVSGDPARGRMRSRWMKA